MSTIMKRLSDVMRRHADEYCKPTHIFLSWDTYGSLQEETTDNIKRVLDCNIRIVRGHRYIACGSITEE